MLSISGRMELDNWEGFEICGGDQVPGDDPGFDAPALKIAGAYPINGYTGDPLDRAKWVDLGINYDPDDKLDKEYLRQIQEFQTGMSAIVRGQNPDWKLAAARVFSDGVQLKYVHEEYGFQLVEIEEIPFSLTIEVPVTDDPEGEKELFQIRVSHYYTGEPCATISRSGEPNRSYEIHTSNSPAVTMPRPTNKLARWLAEMIFPDYFNKKPNYTDRRFGFGTKTYLFIREDLPIRPTVKAEP